MSELQQIFDTVNIGMVTLNKELVVTQWNRWMAQHSGLAWEQVVGSPIFEHFPELHTAKFIKTCKAVLAFGNFSFFSQKLHQFLFPFKPIGSFGVKFEHMQQNCTMGPLRGDDNSITGIFIVVHDVTELANYEQKLMELNIRDGLTGIYNRRYFDSQLSAECERHRRYGRELSLIIMDIDFFKSINDTHGHQCGDQVLKTVAGGIASSIRKSDCMARYGGEEFACLLPETGLKNALLVAENFRKHVEETAIIHQGADIRVTVSLGVSGYAPGDSSETLLERADRALYQAKRTGRNKVVGQEELPERSRPLPHFAEDEAADATTLP
jgi:diguanylate cyclase